MKYYKKIIYTISLLALAVWLLPAAGCHSSSPDSTSLRESAIEITYAADFAGPTASGNVKLEVNITVINRGYQTFAVSPEIFAVIVGKYSYIAEQSSLEPVNLADGEVSRGMLTFYVPPDAASPKIGYQMFCTVQDQYKVTWIEIPRTASETDAVAHVPEISIAYSESYMWIKETSTLYLLVNFDIQNKGYESFSTSPEKFALKIGEVFGEPAPLPDIAFDGQLNNERNGSYSDLRSFELQDGARLSGVLAFKVPVSIFKSMESNKIIYSGIRTYNIQWTKNPPKGMN
jgi:hypothetical protein